MNTNVGVLRARSAYAHSDTPVVVSAGDNKLSELLAKNGVRLSVVGAHHDPTDQNGNHVPGGTFKIVVAVLPVEKQ